jgi:hypothetical protein
LNLKPIIMIPVFNGCKLEVQVKDYPARAFIMIDKARERYER